MPREAAPQAVVIPARPAMLVVGDRQVPVDEWPLARSAEERRAVEIEAAGDDQLVIAPGRRADMAGWTTLLGVVAGMLTGTIAVIAQGPSWLIPALPLGIGLVLIVCLNARASRLRRFRFDRRSGRLVVERGRGLRRRGWTAEREVPLASILAVQLLFQGHHSVSETQGVGDRELSIYREFAGYELNLILDGPAPSRLNLLALADWDWLRRAGHEVAAYLGVAGIDRLYHGD